MNSQRRSVISGFALTLLVFSTTTPVVAGTLTFAFTNDATNTGQNFDAAGAGATMTVTDGVDTATITSVDVRAPEYESTSPFAATGNTLSAAAGGNSAPNNVQTNNVSTNNALGINNPSISNTNYQTAYGTSNEGNDFNAGEVWVIEFDQTVMIALFNFASIDAVDQFTVTVEDVGGSFVFNDGNTNDDFTDPLSGLVIPAGKDITIAATGQLNVGAASMASRITAIAVDVVPEPTSASMLGATLVLSTMWGRRRIW